LLKFINQTEFSLNQPGPTSLIDQDYLQDAIHVQKCALRLKRAHEFSISLAKTVALFEELAQTPFDCDVHYQEHVAAKNNQLTSIFEKEAYVLVIDGKIGLRIFSDSDEPTWSGTLEKGDFAYVPRGF